eukprot:5633546-Pleurochrysis_carterae.AAC.1
MGGTTAKPGRWLPSTTPAGAQGSAQRFGRHSGPLGGPGGDDGMLAGKGCRRDVPSGLAVGGLGSQGGGRRRGVGRDARPRSDGSSPLCQTRTESRE